MGAEEEWQQTSRLLPCPWRRSSAITGVVYLPLSALKSPDLQSRRHLLEKWIDHLIFPLWAAGGQRGYAGRTLRLWKPGMDENEHKGLLKAYEKPTERSEQSKLRRWRKTNSAGYFGVGPRSLAPCVVIVEGAFDRLALLAAGLEPPDVIALIGTALQMETLPFSVQSVVLALDGDESGQKAAQKLKGELQTAGLVVTMCPVPADGQGKDWSERWRRVPDGDGTSPVFEAEVFDENDPEMNGFLISDLIDLKALEALPVIKRAFAAGYVDESIAGDWDDVQVEFGLKAPEEGPLRPLVPLPTLNVQPMISEGGTIPHPTPSSASRKSNVAHRKAKNKMAKQSRKKNRKRK